MNNSAIFLKEIWEWIVIYHVCIYILLSCFISAIFICVYIFPFVAHLMCLK